MAQVKVKFDRGVEGATNIVDAGTEGTKVASGTTAQRGSTTGQIRFNTTTGLAEYYTGTSFINLDQAPTVSSVDDTEIDSAGGGNQSLSITGSGFRSGATVTFVGASGTDFNASTVTVNSDTQITAVAPKSSFLNAQEPYGVKVTNVGGLSSTLASQINVDNNPTWTTSAGSLGNVIENISASLSATASDAEGDTIAYSVSSGSLPSGLSLNSSTGAITGTPSAVSSDTTSSFDLRATANGKTSDRSFSIITKDNTITNNLGGGTNYAYYPMSGNANDASGNNRNATANSVTFTDTNQVGQAFGNCMSGGGYLQLPFTRGSGSQFAFAVWFRTTSSADQYFLGDVGGAYNIAFSLHMTSSTNIQAVVDGSGGPTYSTNWTTTSATSSLSDGNWHHLFLKQNGNAWRLYIDNVDLGYNSSTMIQRNGVNNLQLGAYGTGTRFQGQLDNARFFDFSPGVTDGTNLYNAENNMKGI